MKLNFTNKNNINFVVAAWLSSSNYSDYKNDIDPLYKMFSATSILKSTKQLILSERVEKIEIDVISFLHSKKGTALHDSLEAFIKSDKFIPALKNLGLLKDNDFIEVNPKEPINNCIYTEKRFYKDISFWFDTPLMLTGESDLIINSKVFDFKETSTFTYSKQTKFKDYQLQGSIYRYLSNGLITEDTMSIIYFFKDWQENRYILDPENYPSSAIFEQSIPLLSLEETEEIIKNKLNLYFSLKSLNEQYLPNCTKEELWQEESVWKYFSKPDSTKATKIFKPTDYPDPKQEAFNYQRFKGKGIVKEFESIPKACTYCNAASICVQRLNYFNNFIEEVENE